MIGSEHNQRHHHEILKLISRDALLHQARRLGLARGKTLILDDMDEMHYVYDLDIVDSWTANAPTLFGLKHGLLIGIAAGLISFVPHLGSLSGLVISTCVAIAQFWPNWAVIWIVPAIFFVGQTLSDYLLSPYFLGRRVNLNPVWIMFALFAFGYPFGFVGLLVAVPLASAIEVLTRFALQRYYESFLPEGNWTDAVRLTPSDKKVKLITAHLCTARCSSL